MGRIYGHETILDQRRSTMHRAISRRGLLAGGAGAAAIAVAGRRIGAAQETSADASPTVGWSYTDFIGRVVTLPQAPKRIASEIGGAAALYDMGIHVHAVWGGPANNPDDYPEAWGRLPVDSVVNISNGDGNPDLEKAIAEEIDLFSFGSTALDDPESYGGHDTYAEGLLQIAPIAAWPFEARLDTTIAGIWKLAVALGADPESDTNGAAAEAYDAAVEELHGVLAEKPDLTAFFGYPTPDSLYVANPALWDDVNFFQSLGLGVIDLSEDLAGEWWDVLSWEQALKYDTDLFFAANVSGALTPDELKAHPTFGQHPAAQADQIGAWSWYFARSPQGATILIQNITETVKTAEKVTG